MGARQAALAVVLVIYLATAIAYSLIVPGGLGPDERAHMAYVQSLADGSFPTPYQTHEAQQPPLYYLLAAAVYGAARLAAPSLDAMTAVRWLAALLGLGTVLLTWRLAARLFPGSTLPLFAATFLAATPLFAMMSGLVNNDCLLVFLSTLFLYQLAALPERPTCRRLVLLGLTLGAALLTKQSALALLPLAVPALCWALPPEGRAQRLAAGLALVWGLAGLLYAGWLLRNLLVFGTLSVYTTIPPGQRQAQQLMLAGPLYFLSLIAHRSVGGLFIPEWVVRFWPGWQVRSIAAAGIGLLMVLLGLLRGGRAKLYLPQLGRFVGLALGAAGLLAAGLVSYIYLVDFRALVGGRYLLPALPALSVVVAAGIWGLLPGGERSQETVLAVLIALGLAAAIAFTLACRLHYQHLVG